MTHIGPFGLREPVPLAALDSGWLAAALSPDSGPLPLPLPGFDAGTVEALDMHGVLPLVFLRLRADQSWPGIPADQRDRLEMAWQANALRAFGLEAELAQLAVSLSGIGVAACLLKGAGLAGTVYPSLAERPVSDLDLLVREGDAERAMDALVRTGFVAAQWMPRGAAGRLFRRFRAELPFRPALRLRGPGPLVELHWSLVEMPYYRTRIAERDLWSHCAAEHEPSSDRKESAAFYRPDLALQLIHAAAHLTLHHSSDARLIWFIDIDRIARAPELDWTAVHSLAASWDLGFGLAEALRATREWTRLPLSPEIAGQLEAAERSERAQSMWGLGDERAGRAYRRAVASMRALSPADRLRYAQWLALRLATWPVEARHRRAFRRETQPN